MKISTIVGARPQFIKAAVVSRAFRTTDELDEVMIHKGQHYDENMSEVFFQELDMARPRYNLSIGSGLHGLQTGRMLEAIEAVLLEEVPDWAAVVYGDTNSTLAGALAAAKLLFAPTLQAVEKVVQHRAQAGGLRSSHRSQIAGRERHACHRMRPYV